jgi:hypothetical protein|tara:strand:- start:931 stop:3234 length:2304 start_codon:yes stop_codon:yes gene_type:complete
MPIGDGKGQKEAKKINEELGYILDAVSSIGDKLVASFEDAVDGADALNSGVEIIGKTLQRGLAADLKAVVKNTNNLIDLGTKVSLGLATQADLAKSSEQIAFSKARLLVKQEMLAGKLTDKQKELLTSELSEIDAQEAINKKLEIRFKKLQKSKSLTEIFRDNLKSAADEIDKTGTLSALLSGNFKDIVSVQRLGELAMVALYKAVVATDKQVGEMAKGMNLTYHEAAQLQNEMQKVATTSMSAKLTAKGLGEALMAINSELGITNTTVDENLVFFQQMHKYAGLTYEELKGVNAITNATGGDLKSNTGEILAQAKIQGTKLGVSLNEKEVLKDISKVSAATTISLGMSASEIGKAVSVAKSLGLELGKVDDIAGSLLDFESSISKELEAELLLGKDINLEKARTAALNNDLATVAKEIAEQAGTAAEFASMNRIEQEALAGAVGMGREELGQMLFTQEQLVGLSGEEVALRETQINDLQAKGLSQDQIKAKLAKQSVSDLKKQVSVQENLAAAVDKLKQVFIGLAGPILQIVAPIVDILIPAIAALGILLMPITEGFKVIGDSVSEAFGFIAGTNEELSVMSAIIATIVGAYTAYYAISKGIQVTQGVIAGIQAVQLGIQGKRNLLESKGLVKTVGTAIFSAISSFSKIPFGIGIPLGIIAAAGIASMAAKYLTGDDVMSPGKNGGGYGNRTLMGPEGAIALNNKDTVIAGTNLFPKGDDVMSAGAGEIQMPAPADNSRMEGLLESLVRDQRSRPVIANPGVIQIQ